MQKIQILFPDPLMKRLRTLAKLEDRPVSEVVRRAVERFADQSPAIPIPATDRRKLPTFKGGRILADAQAMKQLIQAQHE